MQAATVSPISHLLDQVKGELADSGIRGEVDRVEISKKGAVQLQLVRGDCRCWFAWEDGEVRELEYRWLHFSKTNRLPPVSVC